MRITNHYTKLYSNQLIIGIVYLTNGSTNQTNNLKTSKKSSSYMSKISNTNQNREMKQNEKSCCFFNNKKS